MRVGALRHRLPRMAMTRREFLAAANAAAVLLFLESCSLGAAGRSASASPVALSGRPYEQVLKLLRQALQPSPDNLAQRAADAVATKDVAKIVEFVRGQVAVVPPLVPFDDASTSRRWGSRATLRSGLGTLRDRAELLAELLTQAGFKAQVQIAARPSSLGVDSIYQARPARFAPDTKWAGQARSVLKSGPFPAPPAPAQFDPGPDPVAAILAALPSSLQVANVREDLLPASVPVVVVEDGGKQRYAFAIGDQGVVDSAPRGLAPRDADAMRNVSITLSAVCNPALGATTPRGQVVELVSAAWPADEVVGRQVLLTFQPPQGAKAILDSGLAALPVRVPTLHVQGAKDLVALGRLITVHGDVLGPANAATTPGAIQLLSDTDRAAGAARVSKIQVKANATAFPDVELAVSLLDASGAPIDGLDAPSFTVKEQGAAVDGFALYSNAAVQDRPRVLIVYDSYFDFAPNLFPTQEAKTAFEAALAKTITDQAAKSPFDVQVVPLGASPNSGSWEPPSVSALTTAFAAVFEQSDDPWGSAGGPGLDQNLAAIVCVSDFDTLDTDASRLPTWKRRLIASGVPVFAIPVSGVNTATADAIVSLSGGTRLNASDLTPLAGLLSNVTSKWVNNTYRIRYRAHAEGPSTRSVTVGVAKASGNAAYTVPASPVPAPAFAGLYLTIAFGPLTATRRIAGLELSSRGDPLGALDDPAVVAETAAALDGVTTIAIEGGAPTVAAVFEDVISSLLSIAPLEALNANPTNEQFLGAAKDVLRTPLALPSLLRPTPVDPGCVEGLRVAILQGRALSSAAMEEHADIAVRLNEIVPLASDRRSAFISALKTSVAMSAAEAASYPDSAYRRLSGQSLTAIQAGDRPSFAAWLKNVPAARQAAWTAVQRVYDDYHLVLPNGGGSDALWVVDTQTGAAKAVLLDSSGGAVGQEGGHCHIEDAFDAEAIEIAVLALACSGSGEQWPFFCNGINTAASGMCVIALFKGKADLGTPAGAIQPWLGLGEAGLGWLDAAIGMYLLLITLSSAGCF